MVPVTRRVEWLVMFAVWFYGGDFGRNLLGSVLALLGLRVLWSIKEIGQ
jgi:hypothetical protein